MLFLLQFILKSFWIKPFSIIDSFTHKVIMTNLLIDFKI